jgi:dTDP-4-amino-4,6-dideoxygalactose transaminase
MEDRIFLSPPHLTGQELGSLEETIKSNWIAPVGPNLVKWSNDLGKKIGAENVCLTVNGTAAIHLALRLANVSKDDIVLVQSHNHIGSVNPIVYQSAVPVFIDSEKESWNMDPNLLEDAIKSNLGKVKAILPVHIYGMPANLDDIMLVANKYGIPVIEDSAESLGSKYDKRYTGTYGDYGILSFNGNKIITTGGGGALIAQSEGDIKRADFLARQAREPVNYYEHYEVGYNYSMSNVLAAIGIEQLKVLDERVKSRRKIFDTYYNYFQAWNAKGFDIGFQLENDKKKSNRWLTSITIDPNTNNGISKDLVMSLLEKSNIESRSLWKPMNMQPVFSEADFFGNGYCQKLFDIGVCLPSGSALDKYDFDRIFGTLDKLFSSHS